MASKKSKSVVNDKYEYEPSRIRDYDGKVRHSRTNGDAVARAMLVFLASGVDIAQVIRANKLGDRYDPSKYDNQGLLRMAVGNSLRGMVRKGTPVVIGGITVKTLAQRVAVPTLKDKQPARKTRKRGESAARAAA